jgi:OOP family OmpA-OmpF porin
MRKIIVLLLLSFFSLTNSFAQEAKATDMLAAINKDGKIALYINFETSKAEINPESQGIIGQVAAMMELDKSLKISVEGHTDNAGNPKTNQKLSESRANAVMAGIIAKGIDKSRLQAKGWGAAKPLADNNTEDAKARNRRVEIVKINR